MFTFVPIPILEGIATGATRLVLDRLQEVFLRNLGRDYERWVGDAGYRETRARMKVAAFEE